MTAMRVGTRLLILKLTFAVAAVAILLLAMHILLPGLLSSRTASPAAEGPVVAETKAVRVAVPREGGKLPSGPRVALQVAGQVESFARAFAAELGPALGLQPFTEKLDVHVFASHAEAAAFAQEHQLAQDPAHPSAFYGPASGTLAVTLRPYPDLAGLILHVATHLLMERGSGAEAQWSTWLAVGLAVCAEQGLFRQGIVRASPVAARDAYVVLSVASRGAHVPLHMLVRASTGSARPEPVEGRGGPDLFRGPLGSLAYRESGLFVLYLLRAAGPKRREAFLRYLAVERQPGPVPPSALETALGTPLNALENEWFAFLRTLARAQ